jgi:hypothetical protein
MSTWETPEALTMEICNARALLEIKISGNFARQKRLIAHYQQQPTAAVELAEAGASAAFGLEMRKTGSTTKKHAMNQNVKFLFLSVVCYLDTTKMCSQ